MSLTSNIGYAQEADRAALEDSTLVRQKRSGTRSGLKVGVTARSSVGHVALVAVGLTGLLVEERVSHRVSSGKLQSDIVTDERSSRIRRVGRHAVLGRRRHALAHVSSIGCHFLVMRWLAVW